jgi:hypothetical protein
MMPELRQLLENTAAWEQLRSISGVERIGFGLKERGGQVLPEHVFRVYVRHKKPLSALRPEEVIPPEVDGIKTDVVILVDTELCCKTSLAPGKAITRETFNNPEGPGTLGCIVLKDSKPYMLTNNHVFVPDNYTATSDDVYQDPSECIINWSSPVATVVSEKKPWSFRQVYALDGRSYWIDCGLLEIKDGVPRSNTIDGIGAIHQDIHDLAAEQWISGINQGPIVPSSPITLHKRGWKTGLTHGIVVEFAHIDQVTGMSKRDYLWELVIRPTAGFAYSETYRISANEPMSIADIVSMYSGQPVTATRVNLRYSPMSRRWKTQTSVTERRAYGVC